LRGVGSARIGAQEEAVNSAERTRVARQALKGCTLSWGGVGAGKPVLLVSVKPGSEGRVVRDLMDALYPYDRGVRVEPLGGVLAVYSRLEPNDAERILRNYPIRGVLAIRRVLLAADAGDPRSSVEALLREAAERGLKFSRLELRPSSRARELGGFAVGEAARLGLLSREGARARLVLVGSAALLCL